MCARDGGASVRSQRCCTQPPASCSPCGMGKGANSLIPFVGAIVTSVSLSSGVIEIEPPEGLLELS